ncbi:MAG: hypothetical protein WKG01_23235 [Kofleriaceae bacterium]
MKLYGSIAIHVQGEDIMRNPGFLERLKRAFGGKPDLRSGRMRAAIEATAIVESVRDALRRLGATNAVSLVIDDAVLFHDRENKTDDLGDLFLAFHDNSSVFGQGFRELRLAVEHHEAGLHHVIEVQARSEHPRDAPAVRVIISGRVEALNPKHGEDADAYRKRAEPVATDPKALELFRVQFSAFVDRVRDALAAAMPSAARVEVEVAEPRIVRPAKDDDKAAAPATRPDQRGYDPYDAYYPSPLGMVGEMFMWSAMFSMMMPPHFTVVDHHHNVQGHTDDPGIQDGPTTAEASDASGGDESWWGSDDAATDTATDAGDTSDGGGSWWGGDDAGGDFGGDGGGDSAVETSGASTDPRLNTCEAPADCLARSLAQGR